jgi:hypothetical protein
MFLLSEGITDRLQKMSCCTSFFPGYVLNIPGMNNDSPWYSSFCCHSSYGKNLIKESSALQYYKIFDFLKTRGAVVYWFDTKVYGLIATPLVEYG